MTFDQSCSICGRTILKGERTRIYLTEEAEQRLVCALCEVHAEDRGWIWEETAGGRPAPAPRRSRWAWLSHAFSSVRLARPRLARRSASHEAGVEMLAPLPVADPEIVPEEERVPDPAARGAAVGRTEAALQPALRLEEALARFNGSEHVRTVAGLTRTLGSPSVSVGALAGSHGEVRVTVAWELSWYQWAVHLNGGRPITEIAKGQEISQLDSPARQWNAHATATGQLRLGLPAAPREREPAGTGR